MIQRFVLTGMDLKVTKQTPQIYLSHGTYKLVLIFHYLLEPIQQPVAGHGLTGTKQDGHQLANLDLI
jgi:hypothetical protein